MKSSLFFLSLIALSQVAYAETVDCRGRDESGMHSTLVNYIIEPQTDTISRFELRERLGGGPKISTFSGEWKLTKYKRDKKSISANGAPKDNDTTEQLSFLLKSAGSVNYVGEVTVKNGPFKRTTDLSCKLN